MANKGPVDNFSKWLLRGFVLMWVALTLHTAAFLIPYWAKGSVEINNKTKTVRIGLWNYCENYYDEGSPTQCTSVLDYPFLTEEQRGLLWCIYVLMFLVILFLILAAVILGIKMFLLKSKDILLTVSMLLNGLTGMSFLVVISLFAANLDQIQMNVPGACLDFSFGLCVIAMAACFVAEVMMGIEKLFFK